MRAALILLLTGLLASSALAQQSRERLTSSQRVLYTDILAAADARRLDTLVIDHALRSSSTAIRRAAVLSLGQIGARAAQPRVAALRTALHDEHESVAAYAAYSLGLLRDSASAQQLANSLRARSRVAIEAAWALGQIGEFARMNIVAALGATDIAPLVRRQLLLAAAKLRPVPTDAVIPHLRSTNPSIVWAGAYAIARTRAPSGLRALLGLARTPRTPRIKAEIARGLARQAAGDSLGDSAFATLTRLARDPHAHVRINALRSLATFDGRGAGLVVAAFHDPDPNVRIAAAQAYATIPRGDMVSIDWARLWPIDTGFTFRRALLHAAFARGHELPVADEWQRSADWRERAAVAAAVDVASDSVRLRRASVLVRDPDVRVRAAALASLTTPRERVTDTVRVLSTAALADTDEVVRETAMRALGQTPPTADSGRAPRALDWYARIVDRIVVPALAGRPATATILTTRGPITVELYGADAPLTVFNFLSLARDGYYDNLVFHRVVPNFVAQDGDPRGDGNGGPGYSIRDEINPRRYERGVLGMALSGPDTGGSQYFITHSPQPHLDGGYTVFGFVRSGFTALDALVQGDRIVRVQTR